MIVIMQYGLYVILILSYISLRGILRNMGCHKPHFQVKKFHFQMKAHFRFHLTWSQEQFELEPQPLIPESVLLLLY